MSKFIQLGIYVIQFGNREFSIYTDWRGLQPNFTSGGPISCVKLRVTRCSPPNGSVACCWRREAPDRNMTSAWFGIGYADRRNCPTMVAFDPLRCCNGRFRPITAIQCLRSMVGGYARRSLTSVVVGANKAQHSWRSVNHLVMRLAHPRVPGTLRDIPRKGLPVRLRLSNTGVRTMT